MAVALLAAACGGGDAPVPRPRAGYRIDYAVQIHLPDGDQSMRREVAVRRPFAGEDVTFAAGATAPSSGTIADGRHLFTMQDGAALDAGTVAPDVPPGDYRVAPILEDLVAHRLLVRRGRATVAGRRCTDYRTGAPIGDPTKAPSAGEYADWCIDGDGLLLRERWYLDGKLLRATVATHVDPTAPAASTFAPPAGAPRQTNPVATATSKDLPLDSAPDVGGVPYWSAARPPHGFRLVRRVRTATMSNATGSPELIDVVFTDVYRRGADAVFVEHREASADTGSSGGVASVSAGPLGTARLSLGLRGAALRFARDPWVVTVKGTVPVDELRDLAAALRPVSAR